jgi:hypothetical protein
MVGQVLNHMRRCGASGTVIVPYWERAAWWPLVKQGEVWAEDVVGVMELGHSVGHNNLSRGALVPPDGGLLTDLPRARLWAIRIEPLCA